MVPLDKPNSRSNSSILEIIPLLKTYLLYGPGGIGKTSITNKFVYSCKSEFNAVL